MVVVEVVVVVGGVVVGITAVCNKQSESNTQFFCMLLQAIYRIFCIN